MYSNVFACIRMCSHVFACIVMYRRAYFIEGVHGYRRTDTRVRVSPDRYTGPCTAGPIHGPMYRRADT